MVTVYFERAVCHQDHCSIREEAELSDEGHTVAQDDLTVKRCPLWFITPNLRR